MTILHDLLDALYSAAMKNIGKLERGERRKKRRFGLDLAVKYTGLWNGWQGTGRTLNISSGGVAFSTDSILEIGMPMKLSLHWPVLLNGDCPMKLMIFGCVVRSEECTAAVSIERYEFHTAVLDSKAA